VQRAGQRCGLISGLITCTSPGAYALIAAFTLILLQVMPSAGLGSAYVQWGWRIPFVIGTLLAGVLFVHYLHAVEEPPPSAPPPAPAHRSPSCSPAPTDAPCPRSSS
jgi:hypothetical protein